MVTKESRHPIIGCDDRGSPYNQIFAKNNKGEDVFVYIDPPFYTLYIMPDGILCTQRIFISYS